MLRRNLSKRYKLFYYLMRNFAVRFLLNMFYLFYMQITLHHKVNNSSIVQLYGITQDPETKNYMMVLEYAKNGSLRNYLNLNTLSWYYKLDSLLDIARGL